MKRDYKLIRLLLKVAGAVSAGSGVILVIISLFSLMFAAVSISTMLLSGIFLSIFGVVGALYCYVGWRLINEAKTTDETIYERRAKYLIMGIVFLFISGVSWYTLISSASLIFIFVMLEYGADTDESWLNDDMRQSMVKPTSENREDDKEESKKEENTGMMSLREAIDMREEGLLSDEEFNEIKRHYLRRD